MARPAWAVAIAEPLPPIRPDARFPALLICFILCIDIYCRLPRFLCFPLKPLRRASIPVCSGG